MSQDVAAVGSFFNEQWALYEKILENDYLGHRAFYRKLREHLSQRQEPFAFLELGCGDARDSGPLLTGLPVSAYRGVDLASDALEKVDLAALNCPVQLICGSLLEYLQTDRRPAQVVLASFSVHHLSLAEKRQLFKTLGELIPEGGEFVMLDLVRAPDEDRPAYLERRHAILRQTWTALSPRELELVEQHEISADFPETAVQLNELARSAGFQAARRLEQAPMTELLVFER